MKVREAVFEDLPAILAISNRAAATTAANFAVEPETLASWQESWRATRGRHPCLVATDAAGAVVGFAKSSPWKGRCAYEWAAEVTVYVEPEHHRRGAGRALYAALLPMLEERGFRTLLAGITLPNDASVRLHEAFGFRQVATFERIGWKFGRWHTVGYWQHWFGGAEPP